MVAIHIIWIYQKERANSVKSYLVSKGVAAERLFTAGCGERKPVADNSTEIGRAINRRIEFSSYDGISSKCPKEEEAVLQQKDAKLENAVKNNEQVVIEGVYFKFDSDQLTPESETTLLHVVDVLKKYPNVEVEIQGHTDSFGNDDYNESLSDRRAKSVRQFLISKGINSSKLTSTGLGEKHPIEDNATEYGRAVNRRIEFKITNGDEIQIKSSKPTIK